MSEKEKETEGANNPSAEGVNSAHGEIFAKLQDFSSRWYTDLRSAIFDLRRGVAKVLVFNLQNPTRYLYVTLDYANHNYFFVKEFSEDEVFKDDYGTAELQKVTEEQLINLLR